MWAADWYDRAVSTHGDGVTWRGYAILRQILKGQFLALRSAGLQIELTSNYAQPTSQDLRSSVLEAGRIVVQATAGDYQEFEKVPHHLFRETEWTADGEWLLWNDVFRIVHDMVAHVACPNSFSYHGELNGFFAHLSSIDASTRNGLLAARALCAETRLQNSWVNFFERHSHLSPADRPYAEQKCLLAPVAFLRPVCQSQRVLWGRETRDGINIYDVIGQPEVCEASV